MTSRISQFIFLLMAFTLLSYDCFAQNQTKQKSYLFAQNDGDDAYDPFADYSEFDEASDEEADINFFRNGRFFTLAFALGGREFTDTYSQIYSPGIIYGGYLTYFFDLRFALQVGYLTGDHKLTLPYGNNNLLSGNTTISDISLYLKYFMNTQNVTKGLAAINPYLIGGFSQVTRTTKISGNDRYAKDSTSGFDAGVGIEVPIMRHKMFLGIQGVYQFITFPDSNTEFSYLDDNGNRVGTGYVPRGNLIFGNLLLGVNF